MARADAAGAPVCPHCGQPLGAGGQSKRPPRNWVPLVVVGVCLGLALMAGALWMVKQARMNAPAQSVIPDPPPADLHRLDQLAFWDVRFEGREGSRVKHVLAHVLNESDKRRYGVRVTFELYDAAGQVVGHASDYVDTLDPGADTKLRALAVSATAVTARVVDVTEQ